MTRPRSGGGRIASVLLTFAALIARVGTATAAPIQVSLHVGASSPTKEFGDAAALGYQGSLSGTWMLGPAWGVGADVGFHRWDGNDDLNRLFRESDGLSGAIQSQAEVRFRALQLTAHGLYRFPVADGAVPWLKGGMGLYILSSDLAHAQRIDLDASRSYFGFHGEAGLDFPVGSRSAIGLEAGYQRIHLGEFDASDFDNDNWYVLFFEEADAFTFGVNFTWGATGR